MSPGLFSLPSIAPSVGDPVLAMTSLPVSVKVALGTISASL